MDKDSDELKEEGNEAQEAWKKTLETFKEEALKMKAMPEEAYELYSKKEAQILKETSETLNIQADKAREDLSVVAKQINEDGKVIFLKLLRILLILSKMLWKLLLLLMI